MQKENQEFAPETSQTKTAKPLSRGRTLLFALEILFMGALLIIWIGSDIIKKSNNLFVLFFYSFPAEFLISPLPHEPALLYFGKFYSPLTVALVSMLSTVMTEVINYSVIGYIFDFQVFQKIQQHKTVNKLVMLFKKSPFLALWIAGVAPVPFYPFRFLVVLAKYPVWKYALSVVLSRGPRFYILALVGKLMKIPDWLLIFLLVALILFTNISILRNFLKKKKIKYPWKTGKEKEKGS